MGNEYTYSNDSVVAQSKTFLQVNVIDLKKTLSDNDKDIFWKELIDHHCFRGNDTRMPLEQFYFSKENYGWDNTTETFLVDETLFNLSFEKFSKKVNSAYSPSFVGYTVIKYLLSAGYNLCKSSDSLSIIDGFDGILLDISW